MTEGRGHDVTGPRTTASKRPALRTKWREFEKLLDDRTFRRELRAVRSTLFALTPPEASRHRPHAPGVTPVVIWVQGG